MLERKNHKRIKSAIRAHSRSLEADYEKRYFKSNAMYTVLGVVISVLTLAAAVVMSPSIPEMAAAAFMVVWLSGWTFGVLALSRAVTMAWRNAGGIVGTAGALFITLFALPFVGGEIMGLVFLAKVAGVAVVVILIVLIFVNWLFYELMKAPTRMGRKMLDRGRRVSRLPGGGGARRASIQAPAGKNPGAVRALSALCPGPWMWEEGVGRQVQPGHRKSPERGQLPAAELVPGQRLAKPLRRLLRVLAGEARSPARLRPRPRHPGPPRAPGAEAHPVAAVAAVAAAVGKPVATAVGGVQ